MLTTRVHESLRFDECGIFIKKQHIVLIIRLRGESRSRFIERLLIALEMQGVTLPSITKPLVWLVSLGDAAKTHNLKLLQELRAAGIPADMDFAGRAVKAQLKLAERAAAKWTIVVGDDELAKGQVVLKNFTTREEATVPRGDVIAKLL